MANITASVSSILFNKCREKLRLFVNTLRCEKKWRVFDFKFYLHDLGGIWQLRATYFFFTFSGFCSPFFPFSFLRESNEILTFVRFNAYESVKFPNSLAVTSKFIPQLKTENVLPFYRRFERSK